MNIKKKTSDDNNNTNFISSKKEKNQIHQISSNLIEQKDEQQIYNNQNSNNHINQISENFIKKKQIISNKLTLKSENNNNFLNQIITGDKKYNNKNETNDGDNVSFEVRVLFKRKVNKNNENYIKLNEVKKLEQIQMENNIINNKNKFPQDNIKKQPDKKIISKKNLNDKKIKINKDNKNMIKEFIKKEEEKENKIKYDNLDTGKVVFNNIFKKKSIEKKQTYNSLKLPVLSDDILESILLLKPINKPKRINVSSEALSDINSKKENINIKQFYLYYINKEKQNLDEMNHYSTSDDYDKIINNNIHNKVDLSQKLLHLNKRNWYDELKLASDEYKERRRKKSKDNSLYFYLRNVIKIHEHFNWIINSISTYYNILFQNKKFEYNFIKEITLPDNNSELWNQGFAWKGLYIIALPEQKSTMIKNEIKAIKYCFYDFIQILEKQNDSIDKKLTDEIIFPLIGYSNVNGIIIFVSVLINPDKAFNEDKNFLDLFINEIISHNKGVINYYSNDIYNNTNESSISTKDDENNKNKISRKKIYELIGQIEQNYYTENLLESKLFMNMSEFHLIPYLGGKFILINAFKLVPNIFEKKFKNYQKINLFSEINNSKLYDTYLFNLKQKTYFNENNSNNFLTQKELIENYKINIYNHIKVYDITINSVHFRILYEYKQNLNDINSNKTYKNRRFIDNIINYGNNYFDSEFKDMKYIGEKYMLIYDLIEPLKLEYSLMKEIKSSNTPKKNKLPFYIESNYISYFLSWCRMLNKNSYNIKTYFDLKYFMKKFGINSNLKFFALMNIENEEIRDIIKISILTKLIKYIYNQQNTNLNYNNKTKYLFEDEKIGKIFFLIRCILYLNELSGNEKNKTENIYEGLLFYTNIFFCKMRLIDDYLSLGLFKNNTRDKLNKTLSKDFPKIKEEYDPSKIFLLNIIYTARKKPFLFLSELELKLNFVINPFIKFKSSISIESMNKKLKLDHINLNNYFEIFSYINSDEISGFILSKLLKDNQIKEQIDQSSSSNDDSILYYEENTNNNKIGIYKLDEIEKFETKSFNKNANEQNKSKYSNHSRKSSIPQSPSRIKVKFLEKKISNIKWNDISDNIIITLPPLCYKMKFEFENLQKCNNILKDNYFINDSQIFFEHFSKINSIFKDIYSCNGRIERTLLHSLVIIYVISFFVDRNNDECKNVLNKISQIYSSKCYYLSLADLSLINLFQGLSCENYLESEEFYSKCVMLILMLFGDPRGRNNDSHPLMQLPLWKILRKTMKLEKEQPGNNKYFYEMYKSLEFFNSPKDKINKIENNYIFDYEQNLNRNIKTILKLNDVFINEEEQFDINNYINKKYFLNTNIFSDELILLYIIKNFSFPLIEDDSNNVIKKIYSTEFVIYLFKQIQSILIGNFKLYDETYMNEFISDNILELNTNDINKKVNLKETKRQGFNKSSINIKNNFQKNEIEFSPNQLINAFNQGKKILELFSFNTKFGKDSLKNNNARNSQIKEINKINIGDNPNFINIKNRTGKFGIFSHFLYDELLQKLSYKRNAPSGIVIAFGNNSHYECTYDNDKMIKYPLLIYKLKNIIVKKIYSGWEYNIIITNNNEIYSFGNNNMFQCGIPFSKNYKQDNKIIENPLNVSLYNGNIKGISVACGNEHTLILDENHNVYSFGNNEDGVLGVENNNLKSYNLIKVNFGDYNGKIKDIAAGTVHNIALTNDGKIFSWGSAQGGQLGLSENYLTQKNLINFSISTPTLVSINNNKGEQTKITRISCGEAHTIVLNSKKEVYSWGFGSNGQLGLGFCEDSFELGTGLSKSRIFTPKKINALQNKKISDIQCGKTFSMFLDSNGGLYACGVNDLYQLGIPELPPQDHIKNYDAKCKDFIIPTRLEYFLGMKVEKISCGEGHCIAIIKDPLSNEKLIWSWGNNRYGQLGLGDKDNISLPKPITFLFEYTLNKFESVSCGGFHSLCLIKHNEDINWIEDDFKNLICKIVNEMWKN